MADSNDIFGCDVRGLKGLPQHLSGWREVLAARTVLMPTTDGAHDEVGR